MLNSYQAVLWPRSIGTAHPTGNTLLLSSSQLNTVGAPGSPHSWPVTITNVSSSTSR